MKAIQFLSARHTILVAVLNAAVWLCPIVLKAQTWTTVWSEDFNNKTYESCYATGADTYWANCASPSSGPRNSLINGTWEVSNTALGASQSTPDASGGRFLMYWSDASYNSNAPVPSADNVFFRKTLTGLTVGKKYRISYKVGGLLQLPATSLNNPASIALKLNSTTVVPAVTVNNTWQSQSYTWTATSTSMSLEWVNTVKAVNGNDFALDDLLVEVASNPLPVTLVDFSVTETAGCSIQLYWTTAIEKDFHHFNLQRSADGVSFENIVSLPAKGANSSYAYTDAAPYSGTNIYRLQMVDNDGSYRYSNTNMMYRTCSADQQVRLYPVPAHDQVNILGVSAGNKLTVYDALGRAISVSTATGNTATIATNNYNKGMYLLVICAGETIHTARFVVE